MRFSTAILGMGCFLLLGGCSSLNPMPLGAAQHQKEALARWEQCLERQESLPKITRVHQAANVLQTRCEGHRRDVLMSFPETVEPQLNALLLEQTLHSAIRNPLKRSLHLPHDVGLLGTTGIQTAR